MTDDDDNGMDLLIGFNVARRVRQFLGVKNDTIELAIALAVKETLGVVQQAEGDPLAAIDDWLAAEEIFATESA